LGSTSRKIVRHITEPGGINKFNEYAQAVIYFWISRLRQHIEYCRFLIDKENIPAAVLSEKVADKWPSLRYNSNHFRLSAAF